MTRRTHDISTFLCRILVLALFVAVMLPVCGQIMMPFPAPADKLTDIFAGKIAPLSVQLKDLDDNWCRMVITDASQNNDLMLMMKMADNGNQAEQLMIQTRVYYTAGQVLTIENERFLAVYSEPLAEDAILDLMQGGRGKAPAQLTPETPLTLTLLSTRNISTIRDIRPFNLEQELHRGKQQQQAAEGAKIKAQQNQSMSNLRQISVAILMKVQDNKNQFPALDQADALQQLQLPAPIIRHPVTNDLYCLNVNLAGKQVDDPALGEADQVVLAYEATPWPDGRRIVAYMDGHVALLTMEAWMNAMKRSGITVIVQGGKQ